MEKQKPSLGIAIVPFLFLILLMLPCVIILKIDPHIPLIICTGITAFIGIKFLGYSWEELKKK